MLDLNDAAPQRGELIPDGAFCALRAILQPGGENLAGCSEHDLGVFKQSSRSDVTYLSFEFVVLSGLHAGRKFWQTFTVAGGQVGEDGVSKAWNITKSTFRAMVDSALGLDPRDVSDAAKAKRHLRGFRDLDGLEFYARIGVKRGDPAPDGGQYPDKNIIAHVVIPSDPQYPTLKAGQEVAAPPPIQTKVPWAQGDALQKFRKESEQLQSKPAAPQGPAWLRGA